MFYKSEGTVLIPSPNASAPGTLSSEAEEPAEEKKAKEFWPPAVSLLQHLISNPPNSIVSHFSLTFLYS